MEVLASTTELSHPNMCIICEETPDRTKRVLDTERAYLMPGIENIGRKYICEKCGLEIANRFGFVSNEQAKLALHAAEASTQRLSDVKERILQAATDIHAFVTDVALGNERAAVAKWVEGEYIEPEIAPSAPKSPRKSGKAVGISASPVGQPESVIADTTVVESGAVDGESAVEPASFAVAEAATGTESG